MAFDLKNDWPILAAALLCIVGFVAVSSGGGSSSSSSGPTGPTSAELGVVENQDNNAAALATAQGQNQTAMATANTEGIFGVIDALIQNQGNAQSNSLAAQEAEYEAYISNLGTEFGDSTNLLTSQSSDAVQLAALQEELKQAQSEQLSQELLALEGLGGEALGLPTTAGVGIP